MIKRKTCWILLIPSILAFIVSFAVRSGAVKISADTAVKNQMLSCMDYTVFIWEFLSELGIMGILFILVASSQFSSELERGQIKMLLLRVGKRSQIVWGKFIAIITTFMISIFTLMVVTSTSYYIFIADSKFGNGKFALKAYGITAREIVLSILCAIVTFAFLTALTYCLGCRFNMMMTFVIALIAMYAGKYMAGLKTLKFMKYTSFYMENEFLLSKHISSSQSLIFGITSIILITALIKVSVVLFHNADVK
ncbi:hypothetical protein [Clostridium oryzae]|uniref:ABC-2 family transporter protein n=1 Tax=Clostridium oryzae TaxID=1450648 RepID=A0A1V4IC93_9CLOT|nr:hypothetical protein [Clostridium oryzae]OPJ57601.1 ABC-2 family transporter protein [Clostridium oryzae]